ncbi:MAG: tRNA (guanosine(37)-N1)-methyltransferase TrmD [Candidatus Latescibacteria bacterium]|nr:tRNA (guanosine(37)-N1)-methyltransferase TrmD [Candidatus Latescibacterota bacterium]
MSSRMKIDIITIFPEFFQGPFHHGLIRRAQDRGVIELALHNLRDYTDDRHRTVDDTPYGGGAGMIFRPEPLAKALNAIGAVGEPIIYLSPSGAHLTQQMANRFSLLSRITLICGRYRGIDQRIIDAYVTEEISIGDYVVSGGEIPAIVLIDAVARLIPGALGDAESVLDDSFQNGLLDCPWYTYPSIFEGIGVPDILLSGNHARIKEWRLTMAVERTAKRRPDLLQDRA